MFPWLWFHPTIYFPFSGDLKQDIEPHTIWDLPFSGPYRGNRPLERRILAEGAGYGQQLNVLHEALIALIKQQNAQDLPACQEAIELSEMIDSIKQAHYTETASDIRNALESLRKSDPKAYEVLLEDLAAQTTKA